MKTKSNPNIKQATLQAFNVMPDEFRGHYLVKVVKMLTGRKYVYQDSVFRKMRQLRMDGKLDYELAGPKEESLYKKI